MPRVHYDKATLQRKHVTRMYVRFSEGKYEYIQFLR